MSKKMRRLIVVALVGMMVLSMGAAAFAQSVDVAGHDSVGTKLGPATHAPTGGAEGCVDLPAIEVCKDGDRATIKGAAIDIDARIDDHGHKHVTPAHAHRGTSGTSRLPRTGVGAGELFALGMAALSGGGVLLRRLRLSLSV